MKKVIFLDFAETLGYRSSSYFDTDFKIIKRVIGEEDKVDKNSYRIYLNWNDFYNKSLSFSSLSEEKDFANRHFSGYLEQLFPGRVENKNLSAVITQNKYETLCHALYPEVSRTLVKYKGSGDIYILSDGRPSRRLTLELLGLDNYCKGFFISDEIGIFKNNPQFYAYVFQKIGVPEKVVFVDDQKSNLEALSKIIECEEVLINRKGDKSDGDTGEHKSVTKLPEKL